MGRKKRYVPSDVDIVQTPLRRTGVLKRNSESEISEECAEGSVQVDNQCSKFSSCFLYPVSSFILKILANISV